MRKVAVFALGLLVALGVLLPTGCGTSPAGGSGTLTITNATLPSGTVGTAYGAALQAAGGVAPYSFSSVGNTVPAGLALSSAGLLTGTPTLAGTTAVVAMVSDSVGEHYTRTFGLSIAAAAGSGSTLAISTAALASGTVGAAYSATVTAAGGTSPYLYAITSGTLPAGLTFTAAGAFYGTPATAGTSDITVTAVDAAGTQVTRSFSLVIANTSTPAPLSITTVSLPGGTVGSSYSGTVAATGGTAPYTFSISSGSLPAGLTFSSAGVFAGAPTASGTFPFAVRATDAAGLTASQSFTVGIAEAAVPLSITTTTFSNGTVATPYSAAVTAAGGTPPYTFSVASGTLPPSLSLSPAGALSGTPTEAGTFTFSVMVTDSKGATATRTFSIGVGMYLEVATLSLDEGTVGTAYSNTVGALGGTAPYTYAVTSGALPAGLHFTSAGVLSGTPTTATGYTFQVTVTDAKGQTASQSYDVLIRSAPTALFINTTSCPSGTVQTAYTCPVLALGGTSPYTYAITGGSVPTGLTFTSAGTVTGTPTAAGTYSFTVTATDAKSQTAVQTYNVTIASVLSITTTSLSSGTVNKAYSATIAATGGTTPYTFAVTAGSLPAGLAFSGAGALTGTPTTAATYSVTVTVSDATGRTAVRAYSVTIAAASGAISFTTTSLSAGTVGKAYSATLVATGGTSPYSYALSSGSVPAGVTLSSAGVLTGTPTAANTYSFTAIVTDAAGQTASRIFSIEIDAAASAALLLTTTAPPTAVVNTTYSYLLNVSNGSGSVSFALQAGSSLPAGIALSSAGVLSGTPTMVGTSSFVVTFADSSSPQNTGSGTVTFTVVNATATVVIDTTTTLATVPANFFGLHTSVYDSSLSDTTTVPSLLAKTGITTLRYPGGGYSDNYHWAQYAITPFYATSTGACGVLSNGYLAANSDFGHFARLLQASGTSGLITIDYGNSVANASATVGYGTDGQKTCEEPNTAGQPQEAAAWVAYANGDPGSTQVLGVDAAGFDWKTVGFWATLRAAPPLSSDDGYNFLRIAHAASLGVKFWEIGNELYYNGWATNHNAESDNHSPYIYPNGYTPGGFNSRASLAALSPTAYGTNAVQFIQAMKAVDSTIKIGVDFSSPISTDPIPTTWNPDLAQAVCAGTNIDFAIMHYYPGTWKAVQPGELLSLPQTDIPNVAAGIRANLAQYCPANASNIGVWLTETSPNNGLAANFPQPVIGLFTLNDFMAALTAGLQNIDWLELHDGSFLTESEQPGPSFYGILLAHQLAAVGDAAVKSTSSTTAIVPYATLKANGQKGLVLINANSSSAITVQVTVNGSTLGSSATEYSFGVNTTQSGTSLTPTTVPIAGSTFPVTVPAYTAVELLIP